MLVTSGSSVRRRVGLPAAALIFATGIIGSVLLPVADAASSPYDTTSTTGVHLIQVPGLFAGSGLGINEAGWVVGDGRFSSSQTQQAFLWQAGGSTVRLIDPEPGVVFSSGASDINDAGEVVGWFGNEVTSAKGAFRWSASTGWEDMGIVPGTAPGGDIEAKAIDNGGNVVGWYLAASGACGLVTGSTVGTCSFYARPGQTGSAIGSIGVVDDGTSAGAKFLATDIRLGNGVDGVVSGTAGGTGYSWLGFDIRPEPFAAFTDATIIHGISSTLAYAGGVATDGGRGATWTDPSAPPTVLPTLGGSGSVALAINASGWVVGSSETAAGETHAFLWTPADGMTDLGTLGGASSEAYGINDAGLIVGRATDGSSPLQHPVVWDVAGTFDPDFAPEIDPISPQTVAPGETLTITPTITDPDGDAFTVAWSDLPSGAAQVGDSFEWTPTNSDVGSHQVTVTATEVIDSSVSSSLAVAISVSGVQLDPIGDKTATVGVELTFTATATPAPQVPLYQLVGGTFAAPEPAPSGATLDASSGAFSWTPTADQDGDHPLVIEVLDLVGGGFDYEEFTVTVVPAEPANKPPVADAGIDQSVLVGDVAFLDGSGSTDQDGDPLSYAWTLLSAPSGSTAQLAAADIVAPSFTPDIAGDYSAQLTVTDGKGGSDSDVVVVHAAEAPTAVLITVNESIGVADAVIVRPAVILTIGESISVADAVIVRPAVILTIGESISVADAVIVRPAVILTIGESIGVADAVTVSVPMLTVELGTLYDELGNPTLEIPVGGTGTLIGGGFDPNSGVTIEIRSVPIQLGTATADGAGEISVMVSIPVLPAGEHTLAAVGTVDGHPHEVQVQITVLSPVSVTLDAGNVVAVPVIEPGGASEPFDLAFTVTEDYPGLVADGLGGAQVGLLLEPVGPGASVQAESCTPSLTEELLVTCHFVDVPVNTYAAVATVGGLYIGSDEDVVVVYDPSLGFTTGGGWFSWPGTGDRTTFGYTMKYNKKGTNLQGSLLLIRHLPDGTSYRLKSNSLDGLALSDPGAEFGWATFSGKATYQEPGWPEPVGNYRFVVYVEDGGTPGAGVDRLWISVTDGDGNPTDLSMSAPATEEGALLGGGNVSVPHRIQRGRGH